MKYKCKIREYAPATISFYNRDGSVILREPSLVAVNADGIVSAVAKSCESMQTTLATEEDLRQIRMRADFSRANKSDWKKVDRLLKQYQKQTPAAEQAIRAFREYAEAATGKDLQWYFEYMETLVVGSPLRSGAIADFELAKTLFEVLLRRAKWRSPFVQLKLAVCAPADMTQVECTALRELFLQIGAKHVLLIEKPFAEAVREAPAMYDKFIEILPGA